MIFKKINSSLLALSLNVCPVVVLAGSGGRAYPGDDFGNGGGGFFILFILGAAVYWLWQKYSNLIQSYKEGKSNSLRNKSGIKTKVIKHYSNIYEKDVCDWLDTSCSYEEYLAEKKILDKVYGYRSSEWAFAWERVNSDLLRSIRHKLAKDFEPDAIKIFGRKPTLEDIESKRSELYILPNFHSKSNRNSYEYRLYQNLWLLSIYYTDIIKN